MAQMKTIKIELNSVDLAPTNVKTYDRKHTLFPAYRKGKSYVARIYSVHFSFGSINYSFTTNDEWGRTNLIATVREAVSNEDFARTRFISMRRGSQYQDYWVDFDGDGSDDDNKEWRNDIGREWETQRTPAWLFPKGIDIDPKLRITFGHGGAQNIATYTNRLKLHVIISYDIVQVSMPLIKQKVR